MLLLEILYIKRTKTLFNLNLWMAARAPSRRRDTVSCEALLQKLRKGQNELKSSMKSYIRSGEGGSTAKEERRETKINRRKVLFERPLNRVDDLPRKRARLVQLSPDHLVSLQSL